MPQGLVLQAAFLPGVEGLEAPHLPLLSNYDGEEVGAGLVGHRYHDSGMRLMLPPGYSTSCCRPQQLVREIDTQEANYNCGVARATLDAMLLPLL